MVTLLSKIVRDEFDKNSKVTLDHLYNVLSKNPTIQLNPADLKHRVRAIIYSLKKSNRIKRISPSTYMKI